MNTRETPRNPSGLNCHRPVLAVLAALLVVTGYPAGCSRDGSQSPHGQKHKTDERKTEPHRMPATPQVAGYTSVELPPERLQLMGITTSKVSFRRFTKTLRTVGIVEMDETRVAEIHTKFSGWIEEVYVNFVGKSVKRGQPLFSIYSPDLLATQEEYLLALRGLERNAEGPFGADAGRMARELIAAAKRRLELWDVPPEEIRQLERTRIPRRTLTINSPLSGVVIRKDAFKGIAVSPEMTLFVIADLSRIWVQADIYEYEIPYVHLGQKATLSLGSLPGKRLGGIVKFINPVVDETTRATKVRFEFDNRDLILKPGMYATAELTLDMGGGPAVPEEAVIDTGQRKIVFVALGGGRFEPREVTLGNKADDFYPVLSGLTKNDLVATSAQFLLDSESRLKAATGGAMPGMHMDKGEK